MHYDLDWKTLMAAPGYLGTSQNGWPVYDDDHFRDHAVRTTVEGIGFWSASEDVAVVMDDFTQKFHDHIENLNLYVAEAPGYDDWSRALRPVRGQTTGYSNHGSCTARDLNSSGHPRGVSGTYTPTQRSRLRSLVNDDLYLVGGLSVLRSGEFYSSTIDGMHIEINAGRTAVGIVADRIRALKEEFHVNANDKATIRSIVVDVLKNEPLIPNTDLNGVTTSQLTIARAGELNDQKADRQNLNDQINGKTLADLSKQVAGLQSQMAAILAAITPAPTKGV